MRFALATSAGRLQLRRRLNHTLWPVLRGPAGLYRRTALRRATVAVVIGSYGKTTTTRAASRALGVAYPDGGGSNAFSSRALALFTRPRKKQILVEEVGIGARGQMAQYARMFTPDLVVVTAIGSEHGRSLGSLEDTAAEKAKMLEAIRPGGVAVMNGDDPHVRAMASQCQEKIVWYGLGAGHEVRAESICLDWPKGTRFDLVVDGRRHEVRITLIGEHGVRAALAALAIARALGRSLPEAIAGLEAMPPVPNRLQVTHLAEGIDLLDDTFKGSLETVETAIDLFSQIPAQRRILAIGEMEDFPGSQHATYRELGRRVGGQVDLVVALLSRKSFRPLAAGARTAGMSGNCLTRVGDVAEMAQQLREELKPGDVVLLKGRSTARLERVALRLTGRVVGCPLSVCRFKMIACRSCPHVEVGFAGALPPGAR